VYLGQNEITRFSRHWPYILIYIYYTGGRCMQNIRMTFFSWVRIVRSPRGSFAFTKSKKQHSFSFLVFNLYIAFIHLTVREQQTLPKFLNAFLCHRLFTEFRVYNSHISSCFFFIFYFFNILALRETTDRKRNRYIYIYIFYITFVF